MRLLARGAVGLAFGVLAAAIGIAEASAASALCRQLESQLAGARTGGSRADGLLARQHAELRKARRQLRAARCGFLGDGGHCPRIRSVIARMERNIVNIESRSQRGGSRSRARILAALDSNGCRDGSPQRQMTAQREKGNSLLSAFFGGPRRGPDERRAQARPAAVDARSARAEFRDRDADERRRDAETARRGVGALYGGETFQAMCVRLSDGYYFPVSPASRRSDLARDRNNCQAMCPGAEVRVYYKRLEDEETDGMVSTTDGRPYKALPTANRYRELPHRRCSGDHRAALLALAQSEAMSADFRFPVPSPKPGSEDTIPLWIGAPEAAVRTPPPGERSVRVVGPVYLPDPPPAEAPQAPAPPRAP